MSAWPEKCQLNQALEVITQILKCKNSLSSLMGKYLHWKIMCLLKKINYSAFLQFSYW